MSSRLVAGVIYSSVLVFIVRRDRRTVFYPFGPRQCAGRGPGAVSVDHRSPKPVIFVHCRPELFYLDHWCSPTGLDRIKRLFTWDTSCGLVVGLWDNLAAFVSVQWLPQGFSWISDSKVEPTSLTNRAIIGGIIFSGQNKEHPTTPIPVPPWLRGTISSGPTTPCSVGGHCCYMNFSSRQAYSISDLRA